MTLSSIIAIIASVLAGMVWGFSIVAIVPYPKNPQSSAMKQILCKTLDWLDLENAPTWRRILFKILFSVLIITALGYGFYDTYSSFSPESRGFLNILASIIVTMVSCILLFLSGIIITHPMETLSADYFKLEYCDTDDYGAGYKNRLRNCIILNSTILCLWVTVFVVCLYILNDCNVFSIIALSTFIATILGIILTFLGCICFVLFVLIKHTIVIPFLTYIEWLKK